MQCRLVVSMAMSLVLVSACSGQPPTKAPQREAALTPPTATAGSQAKIPVPANQEAALNVPDGPLAPDIASDTWLNSPRLTTADLRGHPVLVEFWTFGCINCVRTAPAMDALYQRYRDQGLIIVGVHTPEFYHEKNLENVRAAIDRLKLPYPVAIDNDSVTWRAFDNHYWPALYLIDKRGVIRATHIGELHEGTPEWDDLTARIEALAAEAG